MMIPMDDKNIERRNLQISGGSTYVISLPKKWIERLNLKNGDSMKIVNNPNYSITLLPDTIIQKTSSHPVIKIKKTDSLESIKRKVISLYASGHDFIIVKSPRSKLETDVRSMIIKLIRTKFVGTEIIESDSVSITIKVLTVNPEMKLELAFNRMYKSTSNMFFELIHAIEKNDLEYAEEIIQMDDEIDRFSHYLTRNLVMSLDDRNILSQLGLEKTSQVIGYKRIITCVERIADHISLIAKIVVNPQNNLKNIPKEIIPEYEKTITLFDNIMNLVSERDYVNAESFAMQIEESLDNISEMIGLTKNNENSVISKNLLYENKRILDYLLDVCEVVMNETVNSVVSHNESEVIPK